jgi:hypothetical protein
VHQDSLSHSRLFNMLLSFPQRHPVLAYVATVLVMFLALVLCLALPAYAAHEKPAANLPAMESSAT